MRNSNRVKIVAGGTAALFGIGVAFAAWTSTGTDSGSVSSIGDSGLTVAADEGVTGLFPTGQQTIDVTVTNTNPYKVALDSITVDSIVSNDADCNVASVTAPDNNTPATTLDAAGDAADSASFPFVVSMSNDANDECQANTFTVAFTANGHSSN